MGEKEIEVPRIEIAPLILLIVKERKSTTNGKKEALDLWLGKNECSAFWMGVLTDIKAREIQDIFNYRYQ